MILLSSPSVAFSEDVDADGDALRASSEGSIYEASQEELLGDAQMLNHQFSLALGQTSGLIGVVDCGAVFYGAGASHELFGLSDVAGKEITFKRKKYKRTRKKGALKYVGFDFKTATAFDTSEKTCGRFIKKDGKVGDLGRVIAAHIRAHRDLYLGRSIGGMDSPPPAPPTCPRWNSFNDDQKVHYWIWTLMSVSMTESGCNLKEEGRASQNPNGKPLGLFQLERASVAIRQGRDPVCYGSKKHPSNPVSAERNIDCAMSIFTNQMKAALSVHGKPYVFAGSSYWAYLRDLDATGAINKRMNLYAPCH